jgi:WD40 repeat protein
VADIGTFGNDPSGESARRLRRCLTWLRETIGDVGVMTGTSGAVNGHEVVYDVFVSYSRSQTELVQTLEAHLKELGLRPWVDYRAIPPSFDWMQEVRDGIVRAQVFVTVISERYMESDICQLEMNYAIDSGKRIIVIVVEEPTVNLPDQLGKTNWIFCQTRADVPDAAEALVQAVHSDPTWTALHTTLLIRASDWDEGGRSRSSLIRGAELRHASDELRKQRGLDQPQPNALQLEFLEESERAAKRRRTVFSVVGAALVAATVIGAVAVSSSVRRATESEQEAVLQEQTSQSRSLATQAVEMLERDLRVGSLLAIEAYLEQPTPDAHGALLQATAVSEGIEGRLGNLNGIATSLAAMPRGDLIVVGGAGGEMRSWDGDGGEIEIRDAPVTVLDLAMNRDGSRLAGALSNGDIATWVIGADEILGPQVYDAHDFEAAAVDFADHGALASVGTGGRVLVWDDDMDPIELHATSGVALTSVRWAPGGATLGVAHRDGIDLIPTDGASPIRRIDIGTTDTARSFAWITGDSLVIAADDHLVRMTEVASEYVAQWESDALHDQSIAALDHISTSPDVITVSRDATVAVIDAETGGVIEPARRVHPTRVLAVAALQGGFVSADGDGSVIQWSRGASQRVERVQPGMDGEPIDLVSSELAAVIVDGDELEVHSKDAGIVSLGTPLGSISAVAIDSDATMVAAANSTGELVVLPIETADPVPLQFHVGFEVVELHFIGTTNLAWGAKTGEFGIVSLTEGASPVEAQSIFDSVNGISSDSRANKVIVAGDSPSIAIVDMPTSEIARGKSLHTDWVNAVAVSPGTGLLASAASAPDGIVIRTLEGGDPLYLREAHDARIVALDFNSAGTSLVSGDVSGHVALWTFHDNGWRLVHIFTMDGMQSGIESIGFQSDGSLLVSGYGADTTRLIVEPAAVIEILCSVVRSDLTDNERSRFALDPGESTCSAIGG